MVSRPARLSSMPPAVRCGPGPSLRSRARQSLPSRRRFPPVSTRFSHRVSCSERVCPRVAGQGPDMPLLPGERQWAGRPGAPHLAVSGDPPFNDGIEDACFTAKICSALLRNGESHGACKCATKLWIEACACGCEGVSPRIRPAHVRKTGGIPDAIPAAIPITPVTTARHHQGEQHAAHYCDNRSLYLYHYGLLSPLCILSSIYLGASAAEGATSLPGVLAEARPCMPPPYAAWEGYP
jgi:hypothetical protein